jgi:hypothetical protein
MTPSPRVSVSRFAAGSSGSPTPTAPRPSAAWAASRLTDREKFLVALGAERGVSLVLGAPGDRHKPRYSGWSWPALAGPPEPRKVNL